MDYHPRMHAALLALFIVPASGASQPAFGPPLPVTIEGYAGDAMEPFVSNDGRWVFFNDSNAPRRNTEIHFAERAAPGRLVYRGLLSGANSEALDGIPSMDASGWFYFTSVRSYEIDRVSIFRGLFSSGTVSGVEPVHGLSLNRKGWVNMGAHVSADGGTLALADARFGFLGLLGIPAESDLVFARRGDGGFARDPDSTRILARVNSKDLEYTGCLSTDGLEIFFTRTAVPPVRFWKARFQIMRATRSDASLPFEEPSPVLSGMGAVEGPSLTRDGRWLYFHKKVGNRHRLYVIERRTSTKNLP